MNEEYKMFQKTSWLGLVFLIILFLPLYLSAQSRDLTLSPDPNHTRLLENGSLAFTSSFRIGQLSISEIQTRGGVFDQLSIEGYGYSTEVGEPQLPMQRNFIAVPLGAIPRIEVLFSQSRDLDESESKLIHRIIPAQEPVSKSADPTSIPFIIKEEAYSKSDFRSRQRFELIELGMLRGVRLFAFDFYPVKYDPVTRSLTVIESATVRVSFDNADLAATQELLAKTASFEYDQLYQNTIFNWDETSRNVLVRHPTKYVILCPPAYTSTMQPFIDWKTEQGYSVILTTVGTGGTIANTTTAIKNYMQSLWNNATSSDPAPSFLLIVGDHGTTGDNITANTGATSSAHITDLTYVRLNGTDYLPEMYFGRFSVSSTTELNNIINKTVTFEKTQMADLSYLGKTVLIAGVDSNYASTHGNGAINYATSQYFNSANGITSNNYLYPASGSSAATIRANANEGRGYMNYTAHGSQTSWADPSFTTTHVNAMTNYDKYGVMVGNCCITNEFNYSSPCFGEAIIRKANAGGVVYIGGTNSTYWNEDYDWAVGYKRPINGSAPAYNASTTGAYDAMFHTHSEPFSSWAMTVGDQIYSGNMAVSQSGSSLTNYYWEIYAIMGDPSLMPYMGVPSVNNASFPSSIPMGITSITVTATPYSRVALSKDGTLYGSQIVPANGTLNLSFPAFTSPGPATLVITAQNKITRIEDITIADNTTPYMTVTAVNYTDTNNNQPEYGDSGRFSVTFQNSGGAAVSNVSAVISCSTPDITITDNSETIASLAAGASVTRTNAFTFSIANNVVNGTQAAFTITMTAGSNTWTHQFTLQLRAPALAFGAITISDPSGNNNGNLDPGESVTLSIALENSGLAASPAGTATLSCSLPSISISPVSVNIPAIAAGASANAAFTVNATLSVSEGTMATLNFSATAGAYSATKSETIEIGAPQELVIGTGTGTQTYPMDRYYVYSTHEAIYLASEISVPSSIKSIAYYKATGSNTDPIENVQIYMKNSSETSMSSGNYSLSGYTLVFSGSFPNDSTNGWMEIDLSPRFSYTGTNLAILVIKGEQTWTSNYPGWTYSFTPSQLARQNRSDSSQPTSLTATTSRPNLRLKLFPQAGYRPPPRNLEAVAGNRFVELTWQEPTLVTPTSYKIFRNSSLLTTVDALTYTDNAVSNGTSYSYYVKAVYSNGDSEASNTVTAVPNIVTTAIIGSGTDTTGTDEACPINVWFQSLHGQSVYTKAELNTAGIIGPIQISHIGFNVTGTPQKAMPDYIVRMGHTTANNTASWISTGLSEVWTSASFQPSALGWSMFELSTPFLWNGTDNLVVDTAFGLIGSYNSSGTVEYTSVANGYIFNRNDSSNQTNTFTGGSSSNSRPNLKLQVFPNVDGALIRVQPNSMDFGSIPVGTSSTQQFSIQNYGSETLSGTITTPARFSVSLAREIRDSADEGERNSIDFSVNAGQSQAYNLSFTPLAATTYGGNVTITSNASNSPTINIPLSGSGYIPPTISLSTNSLSQTLLPGEESSQSFTISNNGSQPLTYSIVAAETRSRNTRLLTASGKDRSIAGSTLTLDTDSYISGTTVDWIFTVTNASTDTEWLKGVTISFPAGVTVNSASNFVGGSGGDLTPDLTSGNGITINWFGESSSGYGLIQGYQTASATVSVTINAAGEMNLPFEIIGDVWGSEPHTLSGSITLSHDTPPIEWLSLLPSGGTIPAGGNASITAHFSSIGIAAGDYAAQITVYSNDPLHPGSLIDVDFHVIEYVNNSPSFGPPDHLSFDKNGSLNMDFAPYASDPDGDPLSLGCSGNYSIHVAISGMTATFSAAQNWTGVEEITFTISDGSLTASGTVYVFVDPVLMPSWTPQVYPNIPATVLGIVTIDGTMPASLNDWVGAFVGDECRGMAEIVTSGTNAYVSLQMQLSQPNEPISFRLFRYADAAVYPIQGLINPDFGAVIGDPLPLPLNALTSVVLDPPVITSIQKTATGLRLQWNPVPFATSYKIWRCNTPYGSYIPIATISGTEFIDNYEADKVFYRVQALMELETK